MKRLFVFVAVLSLSGGAVNGACSSADFSGDCKVNMKDFAILASGWLTAYDEPNLVIMASEWLTEGIPEDPNYMIWITIDDDGSGMKDGLGDLIDNGGFTGDMSKYETTNAQYCHFLNAAFSSGDITVGANGIVYGANGRNSGADFAGEIYFNTYSADSDSQITFYGSRFRVRTRKDKNDNDMDMRDHPVSEVSWYGATAFCNYYDYRLPTEWEWQAVADYDGSYIYGCGTAIDTSMANYFDGDNGAYANPLNLSDYPYTNPVDYFNSYGYGINDMAGNVWEWTSTERAVTFPKNDIQCVLRGGCFGDGHSGSYVHSWNYRLYFHYSTAPYIGFRACR